MAAERTKYILTAQHVGAAAAAAAQHSSDIALERYQSCVVQIVVV